MGLKDDINKKRQYLKHVETRDSEKLLPDQTIKLIDEFLGEKVPVSEQNKKIAKKMLTHILHDIQNGVKPGDILTTQNVVYKYSEDIQKIFGEPIIISYELTEPKKILVFIDWDLVKDLKKERKTNKGVGALKTVLIGLLLVFSMSNIHYGADDYRRFEQAKDWNSKIIKHELYSKMSNIPEFVEFYRRYPDTISSIAGQWANPWNPARGGFRIENHVEQLKPYYKQDIFEWEKERQKYREQTGHDATLEFLRVLSEQDPEYRKEYLELKNQLDKKPNVIVLN